MQFKLEIAKFAKKMAGTLMEKVDLVRVKNWCMIIGANGRTLSKNLCNKSEQGVERMHSGRIRSFNLLNASQIYEILEALSRSAVD